MLDHIHIQNYRLFKDLKIDKLGQVNLIAGKNNTGKTALLEALRIWASKGNASVLSNIVSLRGDYEVNNWFSYKNLFNNGDYLKDTIKINHLSIETQKSDSDANKSALDFYLDHKLIVKNSNNQLREISSLVSGSNPQDELIYIPLWKDYNIDRKLFAKISIIEEDDVINILKIVIPNLVRIRIDDNSTKVLTNNGEESQLLNLGDGANRLFTVALALVNAKNKILLIDEFEVGLHHSVQDQLWDIIFKYAKEWNIQVFATTHSRDTVKSFTSIAQKEEYKDMANYFRLQKLRNSEDIVAVHYNEQNLKTAIEQDIETR